MVTDFDADYSDCRQFSFITSRLFGASRENHQEFVLDSNTTGKSKKFEYSVPYQAFKVKRRKESMIRVLFRWPAPNPSQNNTLNAVFGREVMPCLYKSFG
ncbi:hypothetical protein JW992_08120 [candidate division KSB1 bacterium]|nr:hypothetical protein [candidate division KSB1 bacterium]